MTSQLTDQTITFDGRAFINGERVAARSGAAFDCLSPVDGRLLTQVARCNEADVDAAVAAARTAFEDRRWAGLAPAQRKRAMIKFADLLLAHADELALTETLDMGKPVKYAKGVKSDNPAIKAMGGDNFKGDNVSLTVVAKNLPKVQQMLDRVGYK